MADKRIFHVSETEGIELFEPRPSPSEFDNINGDVVFGISYKLLHNYLLPRDCPRVTYYAGSQTTQEDQKTFLHSSAEYIIAIEAKWLPVIEQTILFCYEFDGRTFTLVDECAGYYVSYEAVKPVAVRRIDNILGELLGRNNIELRFLNNLWLLADKVAQSSLNFSLIRMRNAVPGGDNYKNV